MLHSQSCHCCPLVHHVAFGQPGVWGVWGVCVRGTCGVCVWEGYMGRKRRQITYRHVGEHITLIML